MNGVKIWAWFLLPSWVHPGSWWVCPPLLAMWHKCNELSSLRMPWSWMSGSSQSSPACQCSLYPELHMCHELWVHQLLNAGSGQRLCFCRTPKPSRWALLLFTSSPLSTPPKFSSRGKEGRTGGWGAQALFSCSSGAQGLSTATATHSLLSPAVELEGVGVGRWEGKDEQQSCSLLGSGAAQTLARPCTAQLVRSELTEHMEFLARVALTCWWVQRALCTSITQTKVGVWLCHPTYSLSWNALGHIILNI